VRWGLLSLLFFYVWVTASYVLLKWVNPPFTGVHVQRRVESWFKKGKYQKRYTFVPLKTMSRDLPWAVVAAEDGRFFTHHGFDWEQIQDAVEEGMEDKRRRGASTISQQLAKNLFFTTHANPIRKALEFTIVPIQELILGKQRTLELYLNVIEMGPGVYGAESAAKYHYHTSAARMTRDQCVRLAAILPSPRRRQPARMNKYAAIIETRLAQLGH